MSESEQLSQLISQMYDASLDAALWNGVVREIAHFIPGSFVNLFSQDVTRKTAQAFFTFGIEKRYLELYFEKYIHINPLFPTMLSFDVGRVLTEEDVMPKAEFFETRFFKEWVRPQGLIESMASVLDKSATSVAGIAVGRSETQGAVDEQSRSRFSLILPHIRRALLIGKVIDFHREQTATLADTLDGVEAGVFWLDLGRRIVHANASGQLMLKTSVALRDIGGKLSLNDPEAQALLTSLLSTAQKGDFLDAKGAISTKGTNGNRFIAHVLPLTGAARRKAGIAYSAVAAVFVSKTTITAQHPLEALVKAYKLTPTETRVLLAIVNIGGVPEIAPILGISETTVKTHLSHIFAKTGVNRQADLVKIVAAHSSPLL